MSAGGATGAAGRRPSTSPARR
ncbi:hypothetical protein ACF08N_23185 [Streptomyces sp. NPDC015127]